MKIRSFFVPILLLVGCAAFSDQLLSVGQPDESQIQAYADEGYSTIIDLRTAAEDRGMDDEASVVTEAGLNYISFPVAGLDAVNFENAAKLDELLDETNGPVVLHCGSGNRVGALLALRSSLNGASDEEAIATGKEFGMTRLTNHVEKVLQKKDNPETPTD